MTFLSFKLLSMSFVESLSSLALVCFWICPDWLLCVSGSVLIGFWVSPGLCLLAFMSLTPSSSFKLHSWCTRSGAGPYWGLDPQVHSLWGLCPWGALGLVGGGAGEQRDRLQAKAGRWGQSRAGPENTALELVSMEPFHYILFAYQGIILTLLNIPSSLLGYQFLCFSFLCDCIITLEWF